MRHLTVLRLAVPLLSAAMLVGCTEGQDSRSTSSPEVSPQVLTWSDTVEPVWSVDARAGHQPQVGDGSVVASVLDPDSAIGWTVVAWDASSGAELWRTEGASSFLAEVGGTTRVVYRANGSVMLADPRTGQAQAVTAPDGVKVYEAFRCRGLCGSGLQGSTPVRFRLDETTMTWEIAPEGKLRLGDGVTMSEPGTVMSAHFVGDADQPEWTRTFDDMFGQHADWERAYGFNWWEWYGDHEVLLGMAKVGDTDEYVSGGFGHDGTTLWTVPGHPCDEIWSAEPVQVVCQDSRGSGEESWIGVDVRTGEQKWRFPRDGSLATAPDPGLSRLAAIEDARYTLTWADDGPYLIEVATGASEALDGDVFLCSVHRTTDSGELLADSDVMQTCDRDANAVEAPWPARWTQLAGASDGKGRYFLATADQIIAFQF